jgi:biopolymer transport protein ExbB
MRSDAKGVFSMTHGRRLTAMLGVVSCLTVAVPMLALAQTGTDVASLGAAATPAAGGMNYSVIDLIRFGGWVGYIIILLSVVAVALVVEYAMSIRLKNLAPQGEVQELAEMIRGGRLDAVAAKSDANGVPFVTAVVSRGVRESDRGYDAMIKAMEDTSDELTGKLLRKIEHLNIIANIAPMLGLLGTVMGMVNSFNQISVSVGGVDPRRLAGGIFQALMTTVMGLIVAIPALYAFGIFRNRVDAIVAAATGTAEVLVEPLKRDGAAAEIQRMVGRP